MLRRTLAICVGTILCAACASPVGTRIANPIEVQRYLTRNVLTADAPSNFSLNQLRRYDLTDAFKSDPVGALRQLHTIAAAQSFPSETLFALAELSFLQAENASDEGWYVASVVYAYAFLFPEDGRVPLRDLDPRERVAADLYNRALSLAFRRTEQGTLALDLTSVFCPAIADGFECGWRCGAAASEIANAPSHYSTPSAVRSSRSACRGGCAERRS